MANLDDLGIVSISDMQTDEALELLRQIRLSRRIPTGKTKTKSQTKKQSKSALNISSEQAAEILKLITGEDK